MISLSYHRRFEKRYMKFNARERERCDERLRLFAREPFHPLLYNHPLKGRYEGYRSISIGGDLRAVYKDIAENAVLFTHIGTHPELYGS